MLLISARRRQPLCLTLEVSIASCSNAMNGRGIYTGLSFKERPHIAVMA